MSGTHTTFHRSANAFLMFLDEFVDVLVVYL